MEEDQTQTKTQVPTPSSPRSQCSLERNDNNQPVRSRWTPKPEQILILESIFNSGMVNPPKEETIKIRKLLEKFGSVGDANVFYWFQNRRSRSRRRQRQIQASLMTGGGGGGGGGSGGGAIEYQDSSIYAAQTPGFHIQQPSFFSLSGGSSTSSSPSSSSSRPGGPEEIYSVSGQSGGFQEQITSMPSNFLHLDTSKVHYEFGLGVITVFINGVPTELESGPVNMKAMFGEDLMLVHSSGVPMPLDEYGVLVSGLQHGESYFLVSRSI